MNWPTKLYYRSRRIWKSIVLYLVLAGPGLVVMIADNDAGGITTYAATGAKYGYNLIWFLLILIPVAYYVQEMTVRLGAVTKRGHAEAIFDAFGSFWGWFSLIDLFLVDWLTLVTEFIGMTSAMRIFGVPAWLTVLLVVLLMSFIVVNGRYWTWEKIALGFCLLNLIYIPAALMVQPPLKEVLANGLVPNFPGGFNGDMFFFLMANIGTTIAPWMLFFQQSSVVDKGLKEKDIPWGRFDTLLGSIVTVVVAIFIVLLTGTILKGVAIDDAAQASALVMEKNKWAGAMMAIGLFDAGLLGGDLYFARHLLGLRRDFRLGAFAQRKNQGSALVLLLLSLRPYHRRSGRSDPRRPISLDYAVRASGGRHAAAGGARVPDPASERQAHHGRI